MKNNTSVNKIASYLRHEITYNKFKTGLHLKEAQIAKKFSISRVPVREAFRVLQSEGYINVIPNRGVFVKKLSLNYITEVGIVYKMLAPVLLSAAIPKYKAQTFAKANALLNKIEKCKSFEEVGYLLWDFAKVIYAPAKMKFIAVIIDDIYRHNIRWLSEVFEITGPKKYDITAHREFLELCQQKKSKEAIDKWCAHIEKVKQIITSLND